MYQEGGFGFQCGNNSEYKIGNANRYIRYHIVGSLEMCNLLLDDWTWFKNETIVKYYLLPICNVIIKHYNLHFTDINNITNKINIYPSQSLETWQCPDIPPNSNNCVLNPTEQIAGLNTILNRLLKLPSNLITNDDITLWQGLLNKLPQISLIKDSKNKDNLIIAPGEVLPSKTSNSENTELYTVIDFLFYGFACFVWLYY